jgi:hypothetical protein
VLTPRRPVPARREEGPDVDPRRIGAVGESMGGEEVIGAAGSDPRIRAVVAEGAVKRVTGDLRYLPGRGGFIRRTMSSIQDRVADLLTDAHPPIALHDAIGEIAPRPVLLIASKDGD